ncbi:MAG TPA: type II secretion system F family protein [Candidatus Moranbacteria bacterium]|nr:type II secretion system F family protein [Candidatus Moranbacteria bacterium]
MKFNFKAKTPSGEYKEGTINASTKELAVTILQKNNLLPVSVQVEEQENDFSKIFFKYYDRVTEKELVIFFRQLAILIEARVPIVVSLSAILEQTASKYFIKIIREMVNDIEDGMSFSASMEKHKDVFSNLSINIVRAGEASGNLKKSIDYVAENIERNYNLTKRVQSALIYPGLVLLVFFIIGFLVISFVLPNLTAIIKELNADIPWYTKSVIVVGDFMKVYWWAVATIIIAFVGAIMYYLNTEDGRKEWDQIKIKLPIVGPIFRYVYITRFAENLGVLLSGGIPIIRAITIVSSVINNIVFEKIFLEAAEEVKRGGNMSTVLGRSSDIPPMVTHMVRIGEESGQIDSVLGHIAKFYDQETEMMAKNLSTLLEPVLMIFIGIAVGFMAFAILMPIYNIAGQIK